ncbi:MAG: SulP family inorganic anion transporter [Oligoflexia bacterium]|nr:SulP family inorganic anion transporter [Oligoflexia bacterium]
MADVARQGTAKSIGRKEGGSLQAAELLGEVFGGFSAMLVALPSAIAFGLLIFAPLGGELGAQGAMAGILGTIALGLVAPALGGTPRLVTAPCAPAAAVLAALTIELAGKGASGTLALEWVPAILMAVAGLCGVFQFLFGYFGGGRLIKYIPYPVVAGYLSGVGLLIIGAQLPKFLGVPKGLPLWQGLLAFESWRPESILVGLSAVGAMIFGPKLVRGVPAPILALGSALALYFGLAATVWPELWALAGNSLVIGPIADAAGGSFFGNFTARLGSFSGLAVSPNLGEILGRFILVPAATLAVLLSIDTLKTCVIVDALTRGRHDSNRELRGQGLGNLASAFLGGIPGAGTMGATLVNLHGGGKSRLSSALCGVFALAVLLLLGRLVAWVPVPALAGILLVVGFRMIDRQSLKLLGRSSTVLDFAVVAAVILTAVSLNLIAAAGVGFGLAVLLFLREQIRGSVVRRRFFGNRIFSKKKRLEAERAILEAEGGKTVVFELQGSLFFGTTDQLFSELEPHLGESRYVVLDLRRVRSLDFTAAHLLEQIAVRVRENGGVFVFTHLSQALELGLAGTELSRHGVRTFPRLNDALEWIEDELLRKAAALPAGEPSPLALAEIDLLRELSGEALQAFAACAQERSFREGERIFTQGDRGGELYLIRRGTVRILLPLGGGQFHHLTSFGRGDFFGDMSFLDRGVRSADAVASGATDLYVVSRDEFNRVSRAHPELGARFFARLASVLAVRLRQTDTELRALEES